MSRRRSRSTVILMIFGIFLFLTGGLIVYFLKDIVHGVMGKVLHYSPEFIFYEDWKKIPIPSVTKVYFFNWSNPESVSVNGSIPVVTEVGPYTFWEYQTRVNITWNDNNTVTYRNHRTWHFMANLSNGTMDDIITSLNPVAATVAYLTREQSNFMQRSASFLLSATGQNIMIRKSVKEQLFEGYDDKILSLASNFKLTESGKIGWLHQVNGTSKLDGVLNVDTGRADISQIAQVRQWNHADHVHKLTGSCSPLKGTNSEQFNPGLEKTNVTIFSPWICKSVTMDYVKEEVFEGVLGYRFAGGERNIDNGTKYPENICNCHGECFPSGIINVSSCHLDGPVFVSYPHFYKADRYYLQQVHGLTPTEEKHETYAIVEPVTGIILKISGRIQLNMLVKKNSLIRLYEHVPTTFIPILWIDRSIELPTYYITILRVVLCIPTAMYVIFLCIFIVGLVLIFTALVRARNSGQFWKSLCGDENENCKPDYSHALMEKSITPSTNSEE